MTAIVGVYCEDGVVIGTDSSVSFSAGAHFRTIEQKAEKITIIHDQVIVAGTGQVGMGQRFCDVIEKGWNEEKIFSKLSYLDVGRYLAQQGVQDFSSTGAKRESFGALIAFTCKEKHHLCEFQVDDFQPEFKNETLWYVSMGSAQPITDPFLAFIRKVFWQDNLPKVQDALFAVTWTLDHAVDVNPGGVNGPVRIAVLERSAASGGKLSARLLDDSELAEHREAIDAAENRLREFQKSYQSNDAPDLPEVGEE